MRIRLILTNVSLVALGLLLAQLPGLSQARRATAQKTTTESGWYKYGQPIPDLKGPAPKLANGKTSIAGMWRHTRRANVTDPKVQAGYVPELPFTAWGKRQWDNYDVVKHGDYAGSCMPFGWSRTLYGPHPIQFIQDEDKLVMLAEQNTWFTIVYTDGRPHDKEIASTWDGDTVGHWEGDKLVLETVNLNGYIKVDTIGHPYSSQLKITQTYLRPTFGTMVHTWTVDDPKTYTRPWTVTDTWSLEPFNTKILEYACMENNLDTLISGAITPWHPPQGEDAP
jgi:hypothetical protein